MLQIRDEVRWPSSVPVCVTPGIAGGISAEPWGAMAERCGEALSDSNLVAMNFKVDC